MKQDVKQRFRHLNAPELLADLKLLCRDEAEIRHLTKLSRSTLWRIENRPKDDFEFETLGKLAKAILVKAGEVP